MNNTRRDARNTKSKNRDCKLQNTSVKKPVHVGRTNGDGMKSVGNLWVIAVLQVATCSPNIGGLLYLNPDGELLICERDEDAPEAARYVATLNAETDPLFVAARLKYLART